MAQSSLRPIALLVILPILLAACSEEHTRPVPLALAPTAAGAGSTGSGSNGGGSASSSLPSGTWLKGDLHSHSSPYSADAKRQMGDDVATCIRLAERAGLDFWALTDHRTVDGIYDPGFHSSRLILLGGMEWGSGGHANTIGIRRAPPALDRSRPASTWHRQVQQVVADTHAQGGIFIINHPTAYGSPWIWDIHDFDAIEVWNQFWAFRQNVEVTPQQVRDASAPLRAAGESPSPAAVHAASFRLPKREQAIEFWEYYLDRGVRVPATGGGDRHMLVLPGYPTTWVYAASRTPAGVLDAIRAGRVFISNCPEGPRLEFTADTNGDTLPDVMIGGEVPAGRPVTFTVTIRNAAPGQVEIVKNGTLYATFSVQGDPAVVRFRDVPVRGDWWRVDLFERLDLSIPGGRPLLRAALDPNLRKPNLKDLGFYLGLLDLLMAVPHIRTDLSYGTLIPTILWSREQVRILNADIRNPTRCRAAISSPIYTER